MFTKKKYLFSEVSDYVWYIESSRFKGKVVNIAVWDGHKWVQPDNHEWNYLNRWAAEQTENMIKSIGKGIR